MKGKIRDFLRYCENTDFGKNTLSKKESAFYQRFNNEMLSLCRSLPESAQTDSVLFLMRYSGVNLGDAQDFFANYYAPIWSILYWLRRSDCLSVKQLTEEDVTNAVSAQSMAMFLHALDDHLTDNQLSASPLTLMLRTEAWMIMDRAFSNLSENVTAGVRTVRSFVDDYYSSSQDSKGLKSLDSYCNLFRRRMAILMIAPILLSMKMTGISDFTRDIEIAYGSFGIAWRLLDDIRDIDEDIEKGAETSIYLCLPERLRTYWKSRVVRTGATAGAAKKAILIYIFESKIIYDIKKRICQELETAASIVEAHNITRLAREFRCLGHPLMNNGIDQEERHGRSGISHNSK